jgi:hypothetical protein
VMICRDKSRYEAGKPSRILPGTVRTRLLAAESSDFSQAARALAIHACFSSILQARPSHWLMAISSAFKYQGKVSVSDRRERVLLGQVRVAASRLSRTVWVIG